MHRSLLPPVMLLPVLVCCSPFEDRRPPAPDAGDDAATDATGSGTVPRDDAAAAGAPPDGGTKPRAGDPPADDAPAADGDRATDDASRTAQADSGAESSWYGVTSRARIVRIRAASGAIERAWSIRGIDASERILGADIRPANGNLYALTDRARLYEIAIDSGAVAASVSLVADAKDTTAPFTALSGKRFGVDWNPVVDRLRVVSDAGENLRIDPATGTTTTDTATGIHSLTAAAYTQSFSGTCRTRLLVIDSAARRLSLQDPPNLGTLTDIGGLGDEPFDEVSAFEIQTAADGVDRGMIAVLRAGRTHVLDIDLARGVANGARPVELEDTETLLALSSSPPAGMPPQSPGELLGLSASQRLISFNRGAPGKLCTSSAITGLSNDERLVGFDVRPVDGALYALGSSATLYRIAVPSGAATLAAKLSADPSDATEPFRALNGSWFGIGWNPVADRLRVISDSGQNLRVQVNGTTTTDAAISGAVPGAAALAYTNAFAGTRTTTLFALSPSQTALIRVGGDPATVAECLPAADPGNPNCGVARLIGGLELAAGTAVNGFDIDGRTGVAFAALTVGPAAISSLYAIDLVRGTAALPAGVADATIGGGEALRSLTLAKSPAVRGFGLTSDGALLAFELAAPSQPTAAFQITGLSPGERLLGIDVRPADCKLYAVSSAGRLYTLDPDNGAATQVAPLSPAPDFEAATFGVDFNPAADQLRVVDAAARNLRIVPSARDELKLGDVIADTALNPGTPVIAGAAYSDSYAGSLWTTLYVIESQLDVLLQQGGTQGTPSPNGGRLTPIGTLGVDVSGGADLDIIGGHNGLAVAAIATSGARSELYSIDLSAGWATRLNANANAIGADGTAPVIGLALELR